MTTNRLHVPQSGISTLREGLRLPRIAKRSFDTLFDVLIGCAVLLFIVQRPAHAYIDPGAGSMLWQVLVGLFAGAVFYVSRFFSRIRNGKGPKDGK